MQKTTIGTSTTETTEGFPALGVSELTLKALDRAGFKEPSPIQQAMIAQAIAGRDCLGNAPTGTGKTAAFLVPILEKVDENDRRVQALILAPTRELVIQISREFEKLSYGRRVRGVAVVGGEPILRQQRMLGAGCQVVVATPGRLMDLMARHAIRLDKVQVVVLDEADQMLDIGFRPAVETILKSVPKTRQTLLLSATMPPEVRDLAQTYLVNPVDVRLIREDEDATIPAIRQLYLMVAAERKFELLIKLLRREAAPRAIVFCRTKRGADRVGMLLRSEGLLADTMHGNLSQAQRNRVLQGFRSGRLTILVATDVVGRGIDVRGVSHVINFDLPEDPTHYVHRIGRTGRMGSDGVAFSLVLPDQGKLLDQIERCISRELEADQVEGVPAPPRPYFRPQPRQGGFRRGPGPRHNNGNGNGHGHGNNGNGHGNGNGNGNGSGRFPRRAVSSSQGVRRRRDREPQGAGRG
ncbi:DEAD/DEAH box helicase [Singulisphaera acidiphila]|uniref:DNA/RNA helicase, superfamily II n=1 Tax=Singulisphaera acidiphila (strain ATCC BAA-1392 / DSM 18658 / VKM B-2454 / MOB10) TaxID=886293 RepID=L0DN49_SINAD|nr:DEAD/DEAH box helicase [Singulisphaera acidiphila]AGA30677.1 DNA/RNA helicase, superfamily II [Singulisphaera acidiphila DSM 18658]